MDCTLIYIITMTVHTFIISTSNSLPIDNPAMSVSTSLPSTIDSTVAINAFRSQHKLLLNLIRHCLPSVTSSLFAEFMIPQEVYDKASNQCLDINERGVALLDCVQSKLEGVPSDFTKFIIILESNSYLKSQAENLVKSYRE